MNTAEQSPDEEKRSMLTLRTKQRGAMRATPSPTYAWDEVCEGAALRMVV